MRVGFYGGSFNPPHLGHAMVVSWLLWTRRVDRVWIVPVFRHAFEGQQDKSLAPFERRLAWCEALRAELPLADRVSVLDVESTLPAPSYTIDTLRHLAARHGEASIRLVIGADVLPQLPRWRQWSELQARFDPIVVGRTGYPVPEGSVVFPEISSSLIRRRLLARQPVDHVLPAAVLAALDSEQAAMWWAGEAQGSMA